MAKPCPLPFKSITRGYRLSQKASFPLWIVLVPRDSGNIILIGQFANCRYFCYNKIQYTTYTIKANDLAIHFLGSLVDIQPGYQARGKIRESPAGSHRLLQAKDIVDNSLSWETAISFNPELNPDRYRIENNDILFIARGYEIRAYLALNPPDNMLASNTFYIIKAREIQPGYLAWWLNEKPAQAYFAQFQVKMGYAYMSKKNLVKLEVPVPSTKTQETISEVLQLWHHEKQLISEIQNLKESLMSSIFLSAAQKKES